LIDEDKGLKPLAPTTIGALPVPKDTFQTSSKQAAITTIRTAFPKEKRLEKLFETYTKMTSQQQPPKKTTKRKTKGN
jgi:hypothetical protein